MSVVSHEPYQSPVVGSSVSQAIANPQLNVQSARRERDQRNKYAVSAESYGELVSNARNWAASRSQNRRSTQYHFLRHEAPGQGEARRG